MNAVRMEKSAFLIAENYMKQVILLGRAFGAADGIASGSLNKPYSDCRAVYDAGGRTDESGEDGGGCGRLE
ncbi:hypothetical protein C1I90_01950 [Akkermansia muciniphila]|nr:hypothetical protein C1I90_01950 [Akkermansia muciniphila]RYU09181.1 hypothetical protein EAJ16_01675 [Akkermansia muciniphila]